MSDDLWEDPNIEGLVWAFLSEQPEVIDMLGDPARIYSDLPHGLTYPAVRVTLIDDEPTTSQPLWLVGYVVQLEAWGGSKADAWRIASRCRTIIDRRINGAHDGYGVVTGVELGGLQDVPDETHKPAKPRFLFTSTIYAHPIATIGAS